MRREVVVLAGLIVVYDRSVEADFSVELGLDDETLDMPWAAGESGPRYCDLKHHPELLSHIEEADRVEELGEFLMAMNSAASPFETAKCDVWSSTDMKTEEEIFHATHKFGSYVDLLFCGEEKPFSFPHHEQFANRLTRLLRKAPEMSTTAEFLIRRCHYHAETEPRDGFYLTFYLFGFGQDETQARQRWAIALKLVENAMRQASSAE
jgi:hypothetical protein